MHEKCEEALELCIEQGVLDPKEVYQQGQNTTLVQTITTYVEFRYYFKIF